jgi:hypothetical protein
MRERAVLVDARLDVESAPGAGTTVRLVVPCGASGADRGASGADRGAPDADRGASGADRGASGTSDGAR